MGLQALLVCKIVDGIRHSIQGIGGVIGKLALLHEVVHTQGTGKPGSAGGGQGESDMTEMTAYAQRNFMTNCNVKKVNKTI